VYNFVAIKFNCRAFYKQNIYIYCVTRSKVSFLTSTNTVLSLVSVSPAFKSATLPNSRGKGGLSSVAYLECAKGEQGVWGRQHSQVWSRGKAPLWGLEEEVSQKHLLSMSA